jgi:hypothetical protein
MSLEIAGHKSIDDWDKLKKKLLSDFDNDNLWEQAFGFFEERMNSRYIYPAKSIQDGSNSESRFVGEGFSIVTILCSTIEALETFYQGKYFTPSRPSNKFEYTMGESTKFYISFLTKRLPFQNFFDADLALDFYKNVRCGLLHEAATRSGWRIRIDTYELVEKKGKEKILNRVLFLRAIKEYIQSYKSELFRSNDRKEAYIRKMDSICNTA